MCKTLPCFHFKSKNELLEFKKLYLTTISQSKSYFLFNGNNIFCDYAKELIIEHNL